MSELVGVCYYLCEYMRKFVLVYVHMYVRKREEECVTCVSVSVFVCEYQKIMEKCSANRIDVDERVNAMSLMERCSGGRRIVRFIECGQRLTGQNTYTCHCRYAHALLGRPHTHTHSHTHKHPPTHTYIYKQAKYSRL